MKAVLVIDVDDELLDDYEDFYVDYDLRALDKEDDFIDSIRYVEDCPLKAVSLNNLKIDVVSHDRFVERWNHCVKSILGETE